MRVNFLLLLAQLSALGAAGAADVPYEYYRWYHDDPIELVEQPGKVLIVAPDGAHFSDVQSVVETAGYRITDSDCVFTFGSRYCVQLQPDTDNQLAEIRTIIDELLAADTSGEYFFSPVFDGPVAPLQEVLIGYEDQLNEAGLDDVIRAAGFTGEYTIVRHFSNGPYVIDPHLQSGIQTLELGNAIHETGLVRAAEANFAFTGGGGPPQFEPIEIRPIPTLGKTALWTLAALMVMTGRCLIRGRHQENPN